MNKREARVRRARKTRARIAEQRANRLVVSRSNSHIYAQIIAPDGDKVLTSASTLEGEMRKDTKNGGNRAAQVAFVRGVVEDARLQVTHHVGSSAGPGCHCRNARRGGLAQGVAVGLVLTGMDHDVEGR